MQKIILTEKTLGVIIDRLRKLTSGYYDFLNAQDVHPLKCKSWKSSGLSDRAQCAKITVHWIFKDEEHPVAIGKKDKPGCSMIHMAFDAECAAAFGYGDEFYFKGNTLIINQTAGSWVKCMKAKNYLTKIVCKKRLKHLSTEELKHIQLAKEEAKRSKELWLETMENDESFWAF